MSEKKSIFITGASAGIGRACAEHFANQGWFVGAYDINPAGAEAFAATAGAESAMAGSFDVRDAEAWQRELAAFVKKTGRLDVLLNNAGILASGPFQEIPIEQHHALADVNIKGIMNGCHAAFSHLQASSGCLINMASASAIYGQPDIASYSASKFFVRGLTEGLNLEWEEFGIRVVDIWPLFVQTDMVTDMKSRAIKKMGVHLKPDDVAEVVYRAAQGKRVSKVHWAVGAVAKMYAPLAGVMPTWATRQINKKLTGMK